MGEIFISYSRRDQEFTDTLISGLKDNGLQVWIDSQALQAGDAWRAEISQAIAECDAFLVILSPNCVSSKNVVKELDIADSENRHIVPIMCETCEIPREMKYQLTGLQWIDFTETGYDAGLERLLGTLRGGHKRERTRAVERKGVEPRQTPQPQPPASMPGVPSPGVQPTYGPQQLAQILCGRWNVQITPAFGPPGQMMLGISPNGVFNGQLMTPAGPANVTGGWQVTPVGQLVMQGQQTMGWAVGPYFVIVQFNQVTPSQLVGVTGGEQVVWAKIG
jgi:hypothetical protein